MDSLIKSYDAPFLMLYDLCQKLRIFSSGDITNIYRLWGIRFNECLYKEFKVSLFIAFFRMRRRVDGWRFQENFFKQNKKLMVTSLKIPSTSHILNFFRWEKNVEAAATRFLAHTWVVKGYFGQCQASNEGPRGCRFKIHYPLRWLRQTCR